jgi:hypothetical protein
MDGKLNMEAEKVYESLGISMPYKIMCKYYNGELLYKRMLMDILLKKWRSKIKIEMEEGVISRGEMINSNGKVYKIISNNSDRIYIGSTGFEIEDRLNKHMLDYEFYEKHKYHYCSSYDVLKHGECKILLLEDNINKKDLLSKESEYINANIEKCVNIIDPLTKSKLYNNDEEGHERRMLSAKHMMKIVIGEILGNNVKIDSMEDMYDVYKKKLKEIMEKKKKLDEDYYMTLVEFSRLKNICISS